MDVCGIRSMHFNSSKKVCEEDREIIKTYSRDTVKSILPDHLKHIWIYLDPALQADRQIQLLLPCEHHHKVFPLPSIKDCDRCKDSRNLSDCCILCKRKL